MEKLIFHSLTEEDLKAIIEDTIKKAFNKVDQPIPKVAYKSRKETAKRLGVSLPTLHEYTKTGKIKAYRIGGKVVYNEDEIEFAYKGV